MHSATDCSAGATPPLATEPGLSGGSGQRPTILGGEVGGRSLVKSMHSATDCSAGATSLLGGQQWLSGGSAANSRARFGAPVAATNGQPTGATCSRRNETRPGVRRAGAGGARGQRHHEEAQ